MSTRKLYPWKRFWVPREGVIHLADNGYLLDPDELHLSDSNAVAWEKINSTPCLALLGEPGIGKSTALEQVGLTSSGDSRLFLNLRGQSNQQQLHNQLFGSTIFQGWLASTNSLEVVLDSLDECLVHIKTLASWLIDEMKKYPVSRLRLRLTCRTAEWPKLLDEELPLIWGSSNFGAYELAPLRRIDVVEAARIEGLDLEIFLKEVRTRGVVPLAIKPATLNFLIGEFKRGSKLPADPFELYHRGCLHLCSEENLSRRSSGATSTLAENQLLTIAEREPEQLR